MTVARHYVMHAKAGQSAALETALGKVADLVRTVPGCEGVELLRDTGNEHRFIFIEKWDSEQSHAKALSGMPAGSLDAVQAAMDGPPDGAYFDYLKRV